MKVIFEFEIIVKFDISIYLFISSKVENSVTLLQSQCRQSIKQIDIFIKNLKKQLPESILGMKLCDFMNGDAMDTDEIMMEKTMNHLDVTVKQTISKGDEGKSWISFSKSFVVVTFKYLNW